MKRLMILFAGLMLAGDAGAQTDKVDAYIEAEMLRQHIPSVSLAVVQGGKVVKSKAYGLANMELNVRATPSTVYQLQSITKSFVASGIMLLAEDGKLALDDRITKYLTGLPQAWNAVTVRQLLAHTSGIPSFVSDQGSGAAIVAFAQRVSSSDEIIGWAAARPLKFAPAEGRRYSSTGYHLLGLIIEKVSGKPWGQFLHERIFAPLGMTRTRVHSPFDIIPDRASGYNHFGDVPVNGLWFTEAYMASAAGGLVSTAEDMARWEIALQAGTIIKPATLAQMAAPVKLRNDSVVRDDAGRRHGLGWDLQDYQGHNTMGHGGDHVTGFTANFARFPDDKLAVILLTNLMPLDIGGLTRTVAGFYVPALAPRSAQVKPAATLAITNTTIIDVVTGATRPNQTVLVDGNRISYVGPSSGTRIPAAAQVVNGTGKFVIPGLSDMHSHVVGFGPVSLDLYLTQGVTNVRDMGAENFHVVKAWRDSIAAGLLRGPRMRIASPIVENEKWLTTVKGWGEKAGTPWRLYERFGPRSTDEVVRWVDSVKALGADHIKVRNWPEASLAKALVDRARERGLPIVAHGNEPFPRTGITTLEHGIWPPLKIGDAARDSMWRAFAANSVAIVPTLVTWPIRLDPPDTAIAKMNTGRIAGLEYVPKATRDSWRDQFLELKQEPQRDWTTIYRNEVRNTAEMHRAGMTLLAGSDLGAPLLVPGFSMHDELELLVTMAGMTPLQALRAATILPARINGTSDSLGTIEEGKLADIVVLDANPLIDIRNTRKINAVIANGRLLNRATLDQILAAAKAAAR